MQYLRLVSHFGFKIVIERTGRQIHRGRQGGSAHRNRQCLANHQQAEPRGKDTTKN